MYVPSKRKDRLQLLRTWMQSTFPNLDSRKYDLVKFGHTTYIFFVGRDGFLYKEKVHIGNVQLFESDIKSLLFQRLEITLRDIISKYNLYKID